MRRALPPRHISTLYARRIHETRTGGVGICAGGGAMGATFAFSATGFSLPSFGAETGCEAGGAVLGATNGSETK